MKTTTMDLVDFYNNPIVADAEVAFNRSGKIRLGYVVSVTNVKRHGNLRRKWGDKELFVEIVVKGYDGTFSKITNRRNLAVIQVGAQN